MSFVLQARGIVLEDTTLRPGYVKITGGAIGAIGEGVYSPGRDRLGGDRPGRDLGHPSTDTPVVEVDAMVAAGFVDVHVHGGAGAQVNGDSIAGVADSLESIGRFHARHGTTSFLATTVSDTPARLETTVAGAAAVVARAPTKGARVLGVHLEGPWIARAKMGAQDPSALRLPDLGELRALVQAGEGCISMLTLAPELPHADELISEALGDGIAVAIGHTDADFDAARRAVDAGARHVTHLFNAMAPIHHRRPGAVTAALLDERVTVEVIADLEHVHPAVLQLVARLAPGRLVAVSDAVAAAGLEPGTYEPGQLGQLGQLEVAVSGGRVTLASDPGRLAGSSLTLDRAVANLVSAAGLPLEAALAAASSVPAGAVAAGIAAGAAPTGIAAGAAPTGSSEPRLGLLGRIAPGAPADLVVLSGVGESPPGFEPKVLATLVAGRAVWDPSGIFAGTSEAALAKEPSRKDHLRTFPGDSRRDRA